MSLGEQMIRQVGPELTAVNFPQSTYERLSRG